ncbi:MAG: hypothetical protein JW829_06195 [Pirellulales bacterium]|nr:hypothetical protein [Pirellulales bacterium]
MFHFHERTKRHLCRGGFFLLCVLPMLAVLYWALWVHLPAHRRSWSEKMSHRLGLRVTVGRIAYPRPGTVAFESVTLSDLHGSPPMASASRMEIATCRKKGGSLLQLHDVRVPSDGLDDLVIALWHAMTDSHGMLPSYGTIDRLHLGASGTGHPCEPLVIKDLRIRPGPIENDTHGSGGERGIQIHGHVDHDGTENAIHVAIAYFPRGQEESVRIEFNTGDSRIPCWPFAACFPVFKHVGRDATFRGAGCLAWSPDQSTGKFRGDIFDIELMHVAKTLPIETIDTRGAVSIEHAQWNNGCLDSISGTVRCGPGTIHRRFIDAAVRVLFCQQPNELHHTKTDAGHPTADPESMPGSQRRQFSKQLASSETCVFDELAFRLALDANGVTLWGACESSVRGTMIAQAGHPILSEPRYRRLPVVNLVYLFVPPVQQYVPATRQAQAIASRLPLPSGTTVR